MSKIMIVDDSKSMRQMVTFTLESAGHEVIEASDGNEALELAKQEAVDLVMTDVNMPNMDGVSLVKFLREMDEYNSVPILMLTTESDSEKKMEGRDAGATGWLIKPFHPDKLVDTIYKVLG